MSRGAGSGGLSGKPRCSSPARPAACVPSATCFWRGKSSRYSHLAARQYFRVRGRALPRGWPLCKVIGACPVRDGHVLSSQSLARTQPWRSCCASPIVQVSPWPAPSASGSGETFACRARIGPGGWGLSASMCGCKWISWKVNT